MSAPEKDIDALAGLLDEALVDFSKKPKQPPRCSDDDLDEFLAPMDTEATKKAAANFEKVLKEIAVPQAFENEEPSSSQKLDTSTASHEFLSELLGIKQFLSDEGVEPEVRMITESLLKDCFTKEVIFPLVQTFRELIREYLDDKTVEISDEERANLLKQEQVFDELVRSYETASEPPTTEQVEHQNSLWLKLKDIGEVPPALVSRFESKISAGNGGGLGSLLPGLGGGGDPNDAQQQCSIM